MAKIENALVHAPIILKLMLARIALVDDGDTQLLTTSENIPPARSRACPRYVYLSSPSMAPQELFAFRLLPKLLGVEAA